MMTCIGCHQDFDEQDEVQSRFHESACEEVDPEWQEVVAERLRRSPLPSEGSWIAARYTQKKMGIGHPGHPAAFFYESRREELDDFDREIIRFILQHLNEEIQS